VIMFMEAVIAFLGTRVKSVKSSVHMNYTGRVAKNGVSVSEECVIQ